MGQIAAVQSLLANGTAPNVQDGYGVTALMAASGRGQTEAVRLLIGRGADLNLRSRTGHTALTQASADGHLETVRLLSDSGALIDLSDDEGRTALIWASKGKHASVARLLLDKGADPNVRDHSGMTSLLYACGAWHKELIETLLAHKADANVQNPDGHTALQSVLSTVKSDSNLDLVRLLLDHGADAHIQDKYGQSAVTQASRHPQCAQLIQEKGGALRRARYTPFDAGDGVGACPACHSQEEYAHVYLCVCGYFSCHGCMKLDGGPVCRNPRCGRKGGGLQVGLIKQASRDRHVMPVRRLIAVLSAPGTQLTGENQLVWCRHKGFYESDVLPQLRAIGSTVITTLQASRLGVCGLVHSVPGTTRTLTCCYEAAQQELESLKQTLVLSEDLSHLKVGIRSIDVRFENAFNLDVNYVNPNTFSGIVGATITDIVIRAGEAGYGRDEAGKREFIAKMNRQLASVAAPHTGVGSTIRTRVVFRPVRSGLSALTASILRGAPDVHEVAFVPSEGEKVKLFCGLISSFTPVYKLGMFLTAEPVVFNSTAFETCILSAAIGHKHVEFVEYLLEHGVDVNLPTGRPPLVAAALQNAYLVKRLLDHGARASRVESSTGKTALHIAAWAHELASVQLLLDSGAEVNARDHNRETPLAGALSSPINGFDKKKVVALLKEKGATA